MVESQRPNATPHATGSQPGGIRRPEGKPHTHRRVEQEGGSRRSSLLKEEPVSWYIVLAAIFLCCLYVTAIWK